MLITIRGRSRLLHCFSGVRLRRNKTFLKTIELIPERIHRHLFGDTYGVSSSSEDNYQRLELPERNEMNLVEHFKKIAEIQISPYKKQLDEAAALKSLPRMPKVWCLRSGWMEYSDDTQPVQVECPGEGPLFFDIEVCMSDGQLPTMAVALSKKSWYSWCSDRLVNNSEIPILNQFSDLIPLESSKVADTPRVVIGHNVAYDRSRVREQYYCQKTATRFWDTMSMSIPIYGMADHQVPLYEKNDTEDNRKQNSWVDHWRSRICKNSLSAVHSKLCGNMEESNLKKTLQTFFVNEPIEEIRNNFQDLMDYCAHDVLATAQIYRVLYPEFVERFPHPATWLGMLEMCSVYLPITANWRNFHKICEQRSTAANKQAACDVVQILKQLINDFGSENRFTSDPWLWQEDWTLYKKTIPIWCKNMSVRSIILELAAEDILPDDVKLKSRSIVRIFGLCWGPYPLHYKNDMGWGFLVPQDEKNRAEDSPHVSKVSLRRGDLADIPNKAIIDLISHNIHRGVGDIVLEKPACSVGIFDFHRLPHPLVTSGNVGDPLSKGFLDSIEEGVLHATRFEDSFWRILNAKKATRFWNNYRARIEEQVTVWHDEYGLEGAIAPSVIPAGTITRRAVHKLWLTAINAKDDNLIGAELKSMIECPEGWFLVGADVDSQEQWIAAVLGDSAIGNVAGSTPFSNMLLAGSKNDQSDLHSIVAREVGISRDKAKVLNYARLYGSGINHAVDFLKQSGIDAKHAESIATKLFITTKGRKDRFYRLSPLLENHFRWFIESLCPQDLRNGFIRLNGRCFLPDRKSENGDLTRCFEEWITGQVRNKISEDLDLITLLKELYTNNAELHQLFSGGFESETFNYLEMVVKEERPKTPILDCRLGFALQPLSKSVDNHQWFVKRYKRSIVNWVVQSSAVDFLHLLITCMKWLIEKYDMNARFALSIHDEIRYMVSAEDRYRCALALSLSNMYVRAMISQKLGINQLPASVAFFSQVDIDKILRKDVSIVCKTPDGEQIPPGEALSIQELVEKTNGSLKKMGNLTSRSKFT